MLWWALGVVVSVIIFGILINRLDAQAVIKNAIGVWKLPLALSLFISLAANLGLSSWQWRTVYDEIGYSIPVEEHAFVKLALYPLRAALPLRAGDLGRAVYLSAQHRVPVALGVATHGLILIVNTTILLYLSVIGFLGAGHIMLSAMAFTLFGGIIIGVVIGRNYLVSAQTTEAKRAGWFERQLYKMRPVADLSLNSLLPITLLGLVTLLAQIVSFSLIATALDVPIPPEKIFTYTPIIMLAGSLPFTFMGLGVREWTTIRLFAPFAGPETLLSLGVLFSVIDQLIFAFIGLIMLPPFIKACRIKDWPGVKEW